MQRYIFNLTDSHQKSREDYVHATSLPEAWAAIGRLIASENWDTVHIQFVTCAPN